MSPTPPRARPAAPPPPPAANGRGGDDDDSLTPSIRQHISSPFENAPPTKPAPSRRGGGDVEATGKPRMRSPWLSAPLILGNEVAANVAYYSISTNMVIYLRNMLEYDDATAAQLSSGLIGLSYTAVLLGGYLADALLGRAKTVLTASATYVLGLSLLTVSAQFNAHSTGHHSDRAFFFAANVFIALAGGGIKPNVSALGADQFDDFDAAGNPLPDKSVFFGWYYFFINVGALLAATVLVWIQTSGRWTLGFGIPTGVFVVALVAYIAGWRGYRKLPPGGPPLARIVRTVHLAIKNRRLPLPADPLDLYEAELDDDDPNALPHLAHTPSMRWLDKAAIVPSGMSWPLLGDPVPTQFVAVSQVEETKQMLRLMPVWASLLPWNLCYAQMASIMVQQAEQMDRRLGATSFLVPPASMTIFATMTIIVLVPAWDRLVRPALERRHATPTTLQRIGVSNAVMTLAMAVAAAVEAGAAAHTASDLAQGGGSPSVSVWWLVPQLVLLGVSEFFFVGAIEFFYQQSPERTRSLAAALELVSYGMASFLNSGFIGAVSVATDWLPGEGPGRLGRLENYYGLLALIAGINTLIFIWPVAAKYTYREFAPPAANDHAVVGLGRSVAGPAPGGHTTLAHSPSSLARSNTIKPYASTVAKSARLQRALTRNASMAGSGGGAATPASWSAARSASLGGAAGASPRGGGLNRSGAMGSRPLSLRSVRFSEGGGSDGSSVAALTPRRSEATPHSGSGSRPGTAAVAVDLGRISEAPGLETAAAATRLGADLDAVAEREGGDDERQSPRGR